MNVDVEKIKALLEGKGRGPVLLKILSKQHKFAEALDTPIGKEILTDVIKNIEMLLEKIITESAKPEELAEYRVLNRILNSWERKIYEYYENLKKISKG